MSIRRPSWIRRAAWLLVPLLVFAGVGRSICWCSLISTESGSHCSGGRTGEAVASCHGPQAAGEERAPAAPCSPDDGCGCVEVTAPAAKAPQGPVLDELAACAVLSTSPIEVAAPPAMVAPRVLRRRPPKASSPPLFVLNASFRC